MIKQTNLHMDCFSTTSCAFNKHNPCLNIEVFISDGMNKKHNMCKDDFPVKLTFLTIGDLDTFIERLIEFKQSITKHK